MKRAAAKVAKEIAERLDELTSPISINAAESDERDRLQRWVLLLAPPQRKPRAKASALKVATKSLDALCREVVFARDKGICVRCGKPAVDWSHCYSRRYKWLRWELDNSWASCKGCHLDWHHRPLEGVDFWKRYLGADRYQKLVLLAAKPRKTDPKLVKLYLESQRRLYG